MELSRFGIEAETSTKQRAYGVENNSKERNLILLGVVLFWHKKRERENINRKKPALAPSLNLYKSSNYWLKSRRRETRFWPCHVSFIASELIKKVAWLFGINAREQREKQHNKQWNPYKFDIQQCMILFMYIFLHFARTEQQNGLVWCFVKWKIMAENLILWSSPMNTSTP